MAAACKHSREHLSELGIRTCCTHDLVDGMVTCGTLARLGESGGSGGPAVSIDRPFP